MHVFLTPVSVSRYMQKPARFESPKNELDSYKKSDFYKDPEKTFRDKTAKLECVLVEYERFDALLKEYDALAVSEHCNARLRKVFASMADSLRKDLYPKDTKKFLHFQSVDDVRDAIAQRKAVLT